jgi:hypothetical protein
VVGWPGPNDNPAPLSQVDNSVIAGEAGLLAGALLEGAIPLLLLPLLREPGAFRITGQRLVLYALAALALAQIVVLLLPRPG